MGSLQAPVVELHDKDLLSNLGVGHELPEEKTRVSLSEASTFFSADRRPHSPLVGSTIEPKAEPAALFDSTGSEEYCSQGRGCCGGGLTATLIRSGNSSFRSVNAVPAIASSRGAGPEALLWRLENLSSSSSSDDSADATSFWYASSPLLSSIDDKSLKSVAPSGSTQLGIAWWLPVCGLVIGEYKLWY